LEEILKRQCLSIFTIQRHFTEYFSEFICLPLALQPATTSFRSTCPRLSTPPWPPAGPGGRGGGGPRGPPPPPPPAPPPPCAASEAIFLGSYPSFVCHFSFACPFLTLTGVLPGMQDPASKKPRQFISKRHSYIECALGFEALLSSSIYHTTANLNLNSKFVPGRLGVEALLSSKALCIATLLPSFPCFSAFAAPLF